jgi:archaellum biogenesis protein FlaJ (TadC family)
MVYDALPLALVHAIRAVLVLSCVLVIVLMQKAEHDKSIKRIDSSTLRAARRLSFVAIAGAVVILLLTDLDRIPQPVALAMLLLFVATTAILAVDIVALNHRPPETGHKSASPVTRWHVHRNFGLFRRRH